MNRSTFDRMYQNELRKLEAEGWEPTSDQEAEGFFIDDEALERAYRAHWDRVDEGRQRAKDRGIDRR